MTRSQRSWQMDWAGPHGTAWGTVNACLTTVTLAWLGHFVQPRWPVSAAVVALWTGIVTVLGVIFVLLRASFSRRRRPAATILYQVSCWLGAGIWATTMTAHPSWPWRWWLVRVAVLVGLAAMAGLLAGLVREPNAASEKPVEQPVPPAAGDKEQATRDALAAELEERLARVCGGEGWGVPNIQTWPRGNGYTFEAVAPSGYSWRSVEQHADDLAADMDIVHGGAVAVSMGISRRIAIVEVTTVDILAGDYPYPDNRPVHSINDDLAVGLRDDGETIGPNLREKCVTLAGETGSGKTNAGHCLTAEIATTDDALEWDWDLTGKRFAAWVDPYLKGEIRTPPIDWVARDGDELLWMTRAALRVGLARSAGYAQLMLDVDDDKVPVSANLPEILVVGDEIARVTGALSEHEQARENLRLITFEHRAAAIRTVFLALRGTDDVIMNSIQSQCHIRGVMKIANKAEAGWVFGTHYQFGPQDTPYPGCGGLSLSSGAAPVRLKYYRMKPSQIRVVARLVEHRRPTLDQFSRLAANGRNPDGSPMDGLLDGELDCYDTRWDRYRQRYGATVPAAAAQNAPAPSATGPTPAPASPVSPQQAVADLNKVMANLDAAVAAANARNEGKADGDIDDLSDRERAAFDRLMAMEGFDGEWSDDDAPETEPKSDDNDIILGLIRDAGPSGIGPKDLLAQMAQRGIVMHRDTLHSRLTAWRDECDPPRVHHPRHGKWAFGPR